MRGKPAVGNLGEHRVGQVLHHQRHPVGSGPAGGEDRARLRLAGLQGHAAPAELAAEPHLLPVVSALVKKERLAGRHAGALNRMLLQLIGKGLLNVEDHAEDAGMVLLESIEDVVDVGRVSDGAVEVGREVRAALANRNLTHANEPLEVPRRLRARQLDLQASQAVSGDPVDERDRLAVVGLTAGAVAVGERVEAAD